MSVILTLIPFFLFLILSLIIAFFARTKTRSEKKFISDYFIANRSLGGFVLAMTCIATYGSVSSFVGGPGQAYEVGFGWVYMSAVQVTSLFLLYGIMGKKIALVGRKIGAVTVIDIIRARYKSEVLANISAIIILMFFVAMMVAQFVGGAKLFEAATGQSYVFGLVIFGIVCVIFTSIGGFRGVAFTDTLCGIAMSVCIFVLGASILDAGGGYENIMQKISQNNPDLLEPFGGGQMDGGLYLTQWLLVGVFTFALPQSVVRCLGFRDESALKKALVIGTIIVGIMMICVTSLGVLAHGVFSGSAKEMGVSVDDIIPMTIVTTLPKWAVGIAIIGPLAASISTVSSLLIMSSSTIIKDLIMHKKKRPIVNLSIVSKILTLAFGLLVLTLSVVPPDVIWKINMFAFGGLESAFVWVFFLGLYWKRANKTGAVASMSFGVLSYCIAMATGFKVFGLHQIVIGISISLVAMVVGSLIRKDDVKDRIFFAT